jgi:hypothetical protein
MIGTVPTMKDTEKRGTNTIKRCSPRCSEIGSGERRGVITVSAQRHELALTVSKRQRTGRKRRFPEPTQALADFGDTYRIVSNRHELAFRVSKGHEKEQYARRDLNPQPSVPKTAGEFP